MEHQHRRGREEHQSREAYRRGNAPKAVKAYAITKESRYVLVQGVPALNLRDQMLALFSSHGTIEECRAVTQEELPEREEFTEPFLIKFANLTDARRAKRKCDDYNFMGGILHVSYAPEFESLEELREKLEQRRVEVLSRVQGTTGGVEHRDSRKRPLQSEGQAPVPIQIPETYIQVAPPVPALPRPHQHQKRPRLEKNAPQPKPSSTQSTLEAIRNRLSSTPAKPSRRPKPSS